MINEIIQDAQERMGKSIDALKNQLAKIRTGRAHPSLLDSITVEYYGADTPLKQLANVVVEDSRTLAVSVFDKSLVQAVEKAILTSDLGLNPATAGTIMRIPLPPLTEERRVGKECRSRRSPYQCKIAIRNIRRDANGDIKSLLKDKDISEDEAKKAEDDIQKVTDENVKQVDVIFAAKEKELLDF